MLPKKGYGVTDEQLALIEPLMPKLEPGGRWNGHGAKLRGMMWILKSGSPRRGSPERCGSWKSVYDHFRRLTDDGMIENPLDRLRYQIDKDGFIDRDIWCVDGSSIRDYVIAAMAS